MPYQIAPLFCRPWTLLGMTPRFIGSHYENNYGGAFTRRNAISEELEGLDPATMPAHVIRRLKQDEAAALNSMALHELVFRKPGRRRPYAAQFSYRRFLLRSHCGLFPEFGGYIRSRTPAEDI